MHLLCVTLLCVCATVQLSIAADDVEYDFPTPNFNWVEGEDGMYLEDKLVDEDDRISARNAKKAQRSWWPNGIGFSYFDDASVISVDEKQAEEKHLDGKNVYNFTISNVNESLTNNLSNKESKDSSDSGESKSNEEIKKHTSSESSSSESTEEINVISAKVKRSLDSKTESLNSVGINTQDKNTSVSESTSVTVDTEHSSDEKPTESTTENAEPTTEFEVESTKEVELKETTETNNAETTTETESQTATEAQSETTETNTDTSEAENIPEESSPSTESDPESTPETNQETTENGSKSTTTEQTPELLSEDSEELPYYSPGSTSTTEVTSTTTEDRPKTMMEVAVDRVNKLSNQIRLVLTTYKQAGVVVLPGQSFFPEPMPMQDFKKSFSVGTMDFKNMRVYGLSQFTVEHINTDVDRMQVYILLHMKKLVILGNYTLRTFFSRAAGPFNVTLLDVESEGVAEIQTAPEGHLEAADSVMDMFTKDMRIDFKNLGFMGSMFQGAVSTVGDALFNSIKPQILERVNVVIRTDVNKKLKEFSTKFINKVNPVDLAFSEARKYCRTQGYDPYNIDDHTFLLGGLVYVNITDFWVEGLSRFYRVGNLSLSMDAGVIEISVHVMTGKLTGSCQWSGQTFGITKYGKTNFTVDHLQVRALVHQSLDVRKKPQLKDLDLELGWVKVTMNSPMTLNMMIEGIINAFPRLIRHIIVDTLEKPLKEKIQEILDKINVESIVDENLPRLDNFGL